MVHYSHLILVNRLSSVVNRCPPLQPSGDRGSRRRNIGKRRTTIRSAEGAESGIVWVWQLCSPARLLCELADLERPLAHRWLAEDRNLQEIDELSALLSWKSFPSQSLNVSFQSFFVSSQLFPSPMSPSSPPCASSPPPPVLTLQSTVSSPQLLVAVRVYFPGRQKTY